MSPRIEGDSVKWPPHRQSPELNFFPLPQPRLDRCTIPTGQANSTLFLSSSPSHSLSARSTLPRISHDHLAKPACAVPGRTRTWTGEKSRDIATAPSLSVRWSRLFTSIARPDFLDGLRGKWRWRVSGTLADTKESFIVMDDRMKSVKGDA